MSSLPEVQCKLCFTNIQLDKVSQHLVICLSGFEIDRKSTKFSEYFILAYILDIVSYFDNSVNIRENNLFDYCFSIYEHFYLNALGKCICSPLLYVDDFCRAVISQTPDPNNKYLNVIPALLFEDFLKNNLISNLSLIFSRAQWLELKSRDGY